MMSLGRLWPRADGFGAASNEAAVSFEGIEEEVEVSVNQKM
jgi:hypothetical protein